MKKLILLVCFLLVSSLSYSQFVENFDYTAGTDLTSNDGWGGTSGNGIAPIKIVTPGLTFPNYAGSGIGNASRITQNTGGTASGEDDTCRFSSAITSGSAYLSFMVNVDSAKTGGDYNVALLNESGSPTTFVGRVFIRELSVGSITFGLSKNSGTADVYTTSTYSRNTTYLLILKYTIVAGTTNDEVSLFVYSSSDIVPSVEPLPTLGPLTPGGTDLVNVGKVLIRQGANATTASAILDGFYASNSWNDNVLPVELASFTSSINKRDVTLNWITASERNNSGFEIERATNNVWSKIGSVAGNGTTTSSSSYSFTDRGLATGNYSYRLKQIDFNGNFEYFNLSNEVNIGIPSRFELSQNYPNPFNPTTSINFDIPVDGNVSIKLFDMSGKEVATIVNEVKTAGYYSVNFNAAGLSSGIYFYNISANNFTATKKMTLIK